MIKWVPYVFVRIILFFIGGITFAIYWPDAISPSLSLNILGFLGAAYCFLYVFFRVRSKSLFNLGWIGLPAIFLGGYTHLVHQTDSTRSGHILTEPKPIQYYLATLTSSPQEKQKSWKAEGVIQQVYVDHHWKIKEGKIVLYFSKEAFAKPFAYGGVLLIKGSPQLLPEPANPGEFDYKKFLAYRNIYHQHFLRKDDVRQIGMDPPSQLMAMAIKARLWADSTISKHVKGEREQAIASALVLGVTDGLDNELLTAYAATGAMHVLAVSGLHISIIYMLLLTLLKPVKKIKYGEWILALVSLFVLWAYAFITGLSPSVLRAVTMFSFMALARPMNRGTNIYNTLAASAFCILLFDPYLIMSVGFQLSYLAVLGIVYLQPGLYDLWQPRARLWDEIWKISCVSIAAQISTFALGLLYFHQFPNYFLLSNLLVIPGSFLVLISGIGVLAVSYISFLATWLGFVLTWLIKLLNIVVFTVEKIPFSLIEGIYITISECWILMVLMIFMTLLFQKKKFSYLVMGFGASILLCLLQWLNFDSKVNTSKITVYNVAGHTAIDFIDRGQSYFLSDSSLTKEEDKIRFHIRPNRLASGVGQILYDMNSISSEVTGGKLIYWNQHVIIHITSKDFIMPRRIQADLIIIANNSVSDPSILGNISTLVIDSSNSMSYSRKMLTIAKQKKLSVHSVLQEGAFDHLTQNRL